MTMGQRIRQARLDAGLSQRQLAGDEMTRNMLSALENDSANPSVATLRYLSEKLCKPVSYFLGEDVLQISQTREMEQVRGLYQAGQFRQCLEGLKALTATEYALERRMLEALSALGLAEQAVRENRLPYAKQLLEQSRQAAKDHPYLGDAFQQKWLTLSAKAETNPEKRGLLADQLRLPEDVLLLKAQAALDRGDPEPGEKLLEVAQVRDSHWYWLRGEAYFAQKEYRSALECYQKSEPDHDADRQMEICCRELEDYKMAYYYATRKR